MSRRPTNYIAAENLALWQGRKTGFRATVVVHCLDGRGTEGLVTARRRGLISRAPALEHR
jgi:hypothetical protein